jgi:hypothetical protein
VISGTFGASNSFNETFQRSQAVLDIFFCRDLYFPTMVAWENRDEDSQSDIASKKEFLIVYLHLAAFQFILLGKEEMGSAI